MLLTCHIVVNPKNGKPAGMISKETYEIVQKNAEILDSAVIYDRDFNYNLYVSLWVVKLQSPNPSTALVLRH